MERTAVVVLLVTLLGACVWIGCGIGMDPTLTYVTGSLIDMDTGEGIGDGYVYVAPGPPRGATVLASATTAASGSFSLDRGFECGERTIVFEPPAGSRYMKLALTQNFRPGRVRVDVKTFESIAGSTIVGDLSSPVADAYTYVPVRSQ